MLSKRQLFLMIFALLSVIAMVFVLLWQRKLQQQFENPELMSNTQTSEQLPPQTPQQNGGIDFLMSDFEDLLSGNDIESLYQGEQNYGFISPQE